jgi:ribosomal 50S subunit-recycling heat shock protein
VNQRPVAKPNHVIRIGDTIAMPQGAFYRIVRVLAVGARRGPVAEIADPGLLKELAPTWTPLLSECETLGGDER